MRVGKIASILSTNLTGIATPDNSNFVFIYFVSDTKELHVKDSAGAIVKTIPLVP
jgi:hypothetical protein